MPGNKPIDEMMLKKASWLGACLAPTGAVADLPMVSVDIETLAQTADAAMVSMAWAVFHPGSAKPEDCVSHRFSLGEAMQHGTVCPFTLKWWMGQPDEARASAFLRGRETRQAEALIEFMGQLDALKHHHGQCWVICKSAGFDVAIIERHIAALIDPPLRLNFRCVGDYRVEQARFKWVFQQAGYPHLFDVPQAFDEHGSKFNPHTALGDAVMQGHALRTWEIRFQSMISRMNGKVSA